MAKLTDIVAMARHKPIIVCDFSPPRTTDSLWLNEACAIDADLICTAYNPGKSVRLSSAIAAYLIQQRCNADTIFNLATRDMNRLAMETHLLGAHALGLRNVVVMKGDNFTQKQKLETGTAKGFASTELVRAIKDMNLGLDYRGREMEQATDFCVGGAVDLGKGLEAETQLAVRKVEAGADFLITQPLYDVQQALKLLDGLRDAGIYSNFPVFFGVQILMKDGVLFSNVPRAVRADLEKGRSGQDIARDVLQGMAEKGLDYIYLIPPIAKGGERDYRAAQEIIKAFK